MKYRVSGSILVGVDMLVEADSPEQALEKADEQWPGITNYVGNGKRGGALIGPYTDDTDANIEAPDDVPEFKHAELEE